MNPLFERAGLKVFERGWLSSNNVIFGGGDAFPSILVDSGHCRHAAQTLELVRHALGGAPLATIVNTHLHSDHCGGNAALQAAYGCGALVPAGEAAKVDNWDEDALSYKATGQQCPRFRRTASLQAGTTIELGAHAWQVIATPGHDPESVALYQPELELLISADALWENGFGVVFPEIEGEPGFDDVRATLQRFETLHVRWIIPGHGQPFEGLAPAVGRALRRLDAHEADPARHARHAAKVLVKYHVMEERALPLPALLEWMARTRYVQLTREHHFASQSPASWSASLLADLLGSGALQREGELIVDA